MTTRFEAAKLKRELRVNGLEYTFSRSQTNDFGEPTSNADVVGTVCGLYHEQSSNVQVTTGATVQTRTKKIPMILCLHDDIIASALKVGDRTTFNNKVFEVSGILNVNEWNIVADISLEVIDDGTHAEL